MKTDDGFIKGIDYENDRGDYFVALMKKLSDEIMLSLKAIPYVNGCEIGESPSWRSPYCSRLFTVKEGPFRELMLAIYPPINGFEFKWGFCICFDEHLHALSFWDQTEEVKSKAAQLILDAVPKMVAALNKIKESGITFYDKPYDDKTYYIRINGNNFDKNLGDVTEKILRGRGD